MKGKEKLILQRGNLNLAFPDQEGATLQRKPCKEKQKLEEGRQKQGLLILSMTL